MNITKAIQVLNERGTNVKDLRKIDYEVYDEDFSEFMTEKQLIDYATDQEKELEEESEGTTIMGTSSNGEKVLIEEEIEE
jgi:uncharacterized ubiquitin-like protein YukD